MARRPGGHRLVRLLAGLIVAGAIHPGCERRPGEIAIDSPAPLAGKNLLLVTLDTTRADFLSCYNGPPGLTPTLDRLAAQGAILLRATSQTNVTNASHVAILSGLYAADARVMGNHARIPEDVDTLASAFGRAGYATAAFVACRHLGPLVLGLRGFEQYRAPDALSTADEIVDDFLTWLDRGDGRPFFAWVHFFDPHAPYEPPERYRSLFYSGDPTEGSAPPLAEDPDFLRSTDTVRERFGAVRDRSYPVEMYKGEIRFVDDELGRLLERLHTLGLDSTTAVTVLADHGESLGEHGIYYMHKELFETNLRIPWIMRVPGFPQGIRVETPVTQIDFAPTVVELFGVRLDGEAPRRGTSLARVLRGESDPALEGRESLVHESANNLSVAVRQGPWKLVVKNGEPVVRGEPVALYRLDHDPDELENLAAREGERVRELRPKTDRWTALGISARGIGFRLERSLADAGDEERERTFDQLRAMGYLEDPSTGGREPGDGVQESHAVEAVLLIGQIVTPEVGIAPALRNEIRRRIIDCPPLVRPVATLGSEDEARVRAFVAELLALLSEEERMRLDRRLEAIGWPGLAAEFSGKGATGPTPGGREASPEEEDDG